MILDKEGSDVVVSCTHEWVTLVEPCSIMGYNGRPELDHYHPVHDESEDVHEDEEGIPSIYVFCHKCKLVLEEYFTTEYPKQHESTL